MTATPTSTSRSRSSTRASSARASATASSCSRRSASSRPSSSTTSADADDVRRRHAAHFLAFAEAAAPALEGDRQDEWFDLVEADLPNLRAALAWSLEHEPDDALRHRRRAQRALVRARLPDRGAALARRRPRCVRRAHACASARAHRRLAPRLDAGRLAGDEALCRREPRRSPASSATPGSRARRC